MNMEYWMRCQMSDLAVKNPANATEPVKPLEGSSVDPSLEHKMDEWASRGSDRLKALVAERLASETNAADQPAPQAEESQRQAAKPEADSAESGVAQAGPTQEFEEPNAEPTNPDRAPTRSSRHASVEDYFSSPVKPERSTSTQEAQTPVEDRKQTPQKGAASDAQSTERVESFLSPNNVSPGLERLAALEAEIRLLKAELQQSRYQSQSFDAPPSVALNATSPTRKVQTLHSHLHAHEPQGLDLSRQEETTQEATSYNERDTVNNASLVPRSRSPRSPARHSPHHFRLSTPMSDRRTAEIPSGPASPSASQLSELLAARESTIRDLQQKVQITCVEKQRIKADFDMEKARWTSETIEHREAFAMQQADSEARLSFLRDEVAERVAELADTKHQLASALQDVETASERLRLRDEECAGEVRTLKARLAASDATRQEQLSKITSLQAQNEEAQQMLRSSHCRNRNTERRDGQVVDSDHRKEGDFVAQLDRERAMNATLSQDIMDMKDEIDLLREQLRISTLDGATEHGRNDSRLGAEASALEQSTMSMQGELQNLREELRGQIRAATEARAEAKAAKDELERSRRDVAQLQKALETSQEKSIEVERRVAETLRYRDEEIRRRVKELKGEKRQMGRALMRSWGERECGEEVPQKYHYAF